MSHALTLQEYLSQKNPALNISAHARDSPLEPVRSGSRSYTRSDEYPMPSKIRRWREFNLATISRLFNERVAQILNRRFDNLHDFSYLHSSFRNIHNENSLDALLIKSNQSIVLEALQRTAQDLISQEVSMVRGGHAKVMNAPRKAPDWAGLSEVQENHNILPGDTKLKWRSRDMRECVRKDGTVDEEEQTSVLWPIRQLLFYCIQSHMRYGYIITDAELVVLRVGPDHEKIPNASSKELRDTVTDGGSVEWQSIPWDNHGHRKKMTINIALWVLHVLAANNGLLDWEYDRLEEETVVDHGSHRQLEMEPASFSTGEAQSQELKDKLDSESVMTDRLQSQASQDPIVASFDDPHAWSFVSHGSRSSNRSSKRKRQTGKQTSRKR